MKKEIQKRFSFIVRSMLWALLFYVVLMLAFNWDDVSNTVTGKNPTTVVTNSQQIPPSPAAGTPPATVYKRVGVVKSIITVMKTITGIAKVSVTD